MQGLNGLNGFPKGEPRLTNNVCKKQKAKKMSRTSVSFKSLKYTRRESVRDPFHAPEIDFNLMEVAANTAGYFRLRFRKIYLKKE